jgi:hypothetical protein
MPLMPSQVTELEATRSRYGCGASSCLACYPIQYGCEYCGTDFDSPIANGELFTCPECDFTANSPE